MSNCVDETQGHVENWAFFSQNIPNTRFIIKHFPNFQKLVQTPNVIANKSAVLLLLYL